MRKELYSIKDDRICRVCDSSFSPTSSAQKACGFHETTCLMCDEIFEISTQQSTLSHLGKYCDNICSTLAQFKSKLSKNLILEYKNPNDWAKRFKKSYGRKPTINDFRVYFNIDSFPKSTVDLFLFRKTKDSRFEIIVCNFLRDEFPELTIVRNIRNIYLDGTKHAKEIDISIISLSLGFEIQDFATHSRDSDSELSVFPTRRNEVLALKKGPTNHEAKRLAAKSQLGWDLIDIWEDEIKDGRYRDIVRETIVAARQKIW